MLVNINYFNNLNNYNVNVISLINGSNFICSFSFLVRSSFINIFFVNGFVYMCLCINSCESVVSIGSLFLNFVGFIGFVLFIL